MTDLSTFKPIPGYEDYLVNENGDIFSKKSNKILIPGDTGNGYLKIGLYKNGKYKFFLIHRLVAQAFLNNPDNLPQINHKNGVKTDNRVENLEFCTAAYNNRHAWENGLCETCRAAARQLGKINTRHLTPELKELFDDIFINKLSNKNICKKYNLKPAYVSHIKNKRLLKTALNEYFSNNPDIVYQPKSNNKVKKISFKEKIQNVISKYTGDTHE